MKWALIFFVVFILASLVIKVFNKPDLSFEALVSKQGNPFDASADSSELMWKRALEFIRINRRIIAAGDQIVLDSVIVVPYATSHEKGSALRIERRAKDGRIRFTCNWWYSRNLQMEGGKEIALYIQKGIGRYDR